MTVQTNSLEALFGLTGKTALVTGAAQGIGQAIALALASAGADLVLVDRLASGETAEQARAFERNVLQLEVDVADRAAILGSVEAAQAFSPHIDILVNNAGIRDFAPATEMPDQMWDSVLAVNLTAAFTYSRELGRHMVDRGHGRIINISSQLGLVGMPERAAYTASKGALIQLTRTLAAEWASAGVTVNAIAPGPILSPFIAERVQRDPTLSNNLVSRVPMGRFGHPADIGAAALYLASPAADYVTGSVLVVDGGYTAI